VYDPSGIGSNFDIRNLSVDQIERIEILKGSQSTYMAAMQLRV
jgi:vitamin B12 transporter